MDSIVRVNHWLAEQGYKFDVSAEEIGTDSPVVKRTECGRKVYYWLKTIGADGALSIGGGNYRNSLEKFYFRTRETLTSKETRELNKSKKQREREFNTKRLVAKGIVEDLFERFKLTPSMPSDYMQSKGIPHFPPAVAIWNQRGNQTLLVVPMFDEVGELWNLQTISAVGEPDKRKKFQKNGRKKGLFHTIGEESAKLLIAEGYATGAAAHDATGYQTVVAFDLGNLEEVLKVMLRRRDRRDVVLLADWDGGTFANTGVNPGMKETQRLSIKYDVRIAVPGRPEGKGYDFADQYKERGKNAVAQAVGKSLGFMDLINERFEVAK